MRMTRRFINNKIKKAEIALDPMHDPPIGKDMRADIQDIISLLKLLLDNRIKVVK